MKSFWNGSQRKLNYWSRNTETLKQNFASNLLWIVGTLSLDQSIFHVYSEENISYALSEGLWDFRKACNKVQWREGEFKNSSFLVIMNIIVTSTVYDYFEFEIDSHSF